MENGDTETKEKKTRHRSPAYPTIGLREAVERLKKFYAVDGKAGAPPEIAVKHMGYATAHGGAMSALSALKKFGLLSEANGRVVPTQRALEIVNLKDGDPRRSQALKDAFVEPTIHTAIIADNPNGVPAPDVLESELTTYKGFNPNSVKDFVSEFLDGMEFCGLSEFPALESNVEDDEMTDVQSPHETPPVKVAPVPRVTTAPREVPQRATPRNEEQISTPVGKQEDGQVVFAHVSFDAGITKEFVSSLKKYLDYLETTLN